MYVSAVRTLCIFTLGAGSRKYYYRLLLCKHFQCKFVHGLSARSNEQIFVYTYAICMVKGFSCSVFTQQNINDNL